MHHFGHRTSKAQLGGSSELQQVWQEHIPEEASKHSFLMHGVLALAAIHIACSEPTQVTDYVSLCDKHQASALASYRRILTHITDEVVDALFAMATILPILSVARANLRASQMKSRNYISVGNISELLYLSKGVKEVKEITGELIGRGRLSTLLSSYEFSSNTLATMPPEILSVFRDLEDLVCNHCVEADQCKSCLEAITHLQTVFENVVANYASGSLEMGHIWRWTAMLSGEFIEMVQAEYPPALVITAHFTVAVTMLQDMWYISTWGPMAFDGIRIALRGQLEGYLKWPAQQIASGGAGLRCVAAQIKNIV